MTISQGTAQPTTDHYQVDGFGRIYDTPIVSTWMTDDDQPGVITAKGANRVDTLVYDAAGRRALAMFGDQSVEWSWYDVTLDNLFEMGNDVFGVWGPPVGRPTCERTERDRR